MANKLLGGSLILIAILSGLSSERVMAIATTVCAGEYWQEEHRLREIHVVDSQGKAISGADLLFFDGKLGKKLKSEENGVVKINQERGVLVGHADGFQYGGLLIEKSDGDRLKLTLKRAGEAGAVKRTLPLPLTEEKRAQQSQALIEEVFQTLEQSNDEQSQMMWLKILGKHCPARTLEFLKANPDLSSNAVAFTTVEVIKSLATQDSEQALELVAGLKEPEIQTMGLIQLMKALPVDSTHASSCETQLLRSIELIRSPQFKLAVAAEAAKFFQSRGKQDQAKQIIDTYLEQAEKLPSAGWSVYPRSLFAALIVSSEPQRAQKILSDSEPASEQERMEALRAQARLAFVASRHDLELTKQLLAKFDELDPEKKQFEYRFKILQMLAERFPEAAIEQARELRDLQYRAWTLGIIANRIGERNPELARKTLAEAVEAVEAALESSQAVSEQSVFHHPATILGGLLPIAERLAPEQMESLIWQTIWCAVPRSRFVNPGQFSHSLTVQQSAAAICRYDRQLGLALFGNRQPSHDLSRDGNAAALFILKPDEISNYLKSLKVNHPFSTHAAVEKWLILLAEEEVTAWNMVSLPWPMTWQSDEFEDE